MIGGPWAIRYTLSHLVKDEEHVCRASDWQRTALSCRTERWRPVS